MSVRTIRRLESGRERVSDTALLAVEAALGWRHGAAHALLEGRAERPDVDDDLSAVTAVWPRLSPRDRATVRALAEQLATRP